LKSEDLLRFIGSVDDKYVEEIADERIVSIASARVVRRKKWLTAAACFAVVILCAALLMGTDAEIGRSSFKLPDIFTDIPMASNTLVMIDVNPSIQLEVNDRGIVVRADAMNDDAETIMAELELKGKSYTDAVELTVSALQESEYISNLRNSVLITVVDKDETEAQEIRSAIVDVIKLIDENTDYDLSVLSQVFTDVSEFADIAESHNMSAGRAALIDAICKAHEGYSFDGLADCNIQTINQLLEYIGVPELVDRIGTAAATVPDELKDELKLDGLTQEELVSFTLAVSDFYDRLCEYYDEDNVANRIGFAFNIVCRENPDGSRLWAVLVENLHNGAPSKGAIINMGDKMITDWYDDGTVTELIKFFEDVA